MDLLNGRYRIIDKIGAGAESEVFICHDIKLKSNWALKRVSKTRFNSGECYREVNILKNLRHPGLPIVVDVFEDEKYVYIVRDYIEGITLKKYVENYGHLNFDELRVFIESLIDILDYLHDRENPIIYRDLKPENIIRKGDGSYFLIDFGITRTYKKESESDTIYMGTKGYAAPELYCSLQSDSRTDVYALGVTIYYAFTGKLFYELEEECRWNPNLSKEEALIKNIVEKCTKFDPQHRYQSVLEIFSELESADFVREIRHSNRYVGKIGIGIMGYKAGVGATHICMLFAKYLSHLNFRVNVIDYSRDYGLSTYENFLEGEDLEYMSKDGTFDMGRIRVYKASFPYVDALRKDCDYQIVDFGSDHFNMSEFLKLQYKFFVLPSSAWSYEKSKCKLLREISCSEDIQILFNMQHKRDVKLCRWLNLNDAEVGCIPFVKNMENIEPNCEEVLSDILNQSSAPSEGGKKRFKFKLFGRR